MITYRRVGTEPQRTASQRPLPAWVVGSLAVLVFTTGLFVGIGETDWFAAATAGGLAILALESRPAGDRGTLTSVLRWGGGLLVMACAAFLWAQIAMHDARPREGDAGLAAHLAITGSLLLLVALRSTPPGWASRSRASRRGQQQPG